MNNNDILKLENQLCFSVYATSRAITKLYRPILNELGITYPQYLVMLVLWEKENITLKDLGNKLYLDSGTLTPLLKRLEAMGYLKRERSTEDERLLCVSITEKGLELKQKALDVPRCIIECIDYDTETLIRLKQEIDGLLSNLNKEE